MLYPNKISAKKGKKIVKILIIVSIVVSILLILLNKSINPKIPWSQLSIIGIIYVWITVIYAINKNTNIAAHVLLQTVLISILTVGIDYLLGFEKWSLYLSIPIVFITANISMFVLTIISYKKYLRYAIYQLSLCILSLIPVILLTENMIQKKTLSYIAIGVSIVNFVITIIFCQKDIREELKRKFHM